VSEGINGMLKLRCYVFGNLVREQEERHLTQEEVNFLEKHREECNECRARELANSCSLEAVQSPEDEVTEEGKTISILGNLGFDV
jgi:hypothetical protein